MTTQRQGPALTVVATCYGCAHVRSTYYVAQGDSGFDVSCAHPDGKNRDVSGWRAPTWCPFLGEARLALGQELVGERRIEVDACGQGAPQ